MTRWPDVSFDMPWLLLAALVLPLCVLALGLARARGRRDRLARFAEPSALVRLLRGESSAPQARTARLVVVVAEHGGHPAKVAVPL